MHRIDAERVEVDPSSDGVHISTVHVNEAAEGVYLLGDLFKRALEDTRGVGVGDHNASNALAVFFNAQVEVFVQDAALVIGFEIDDLTLFAAESSHGSRSKVSAMR